MFFSELLQEKKIQIIGGHWIIGAIKHLINTLVITLTNKFATQITWDGQRETEGIKNTMFSNVIIGNFTFLKH